MAKHYNFIEQAKNEEIDLLFIGDSLTERWQQQDVVDIWNLHFQPLRAANFGIGGDSTHEILWRLRNGELKVVRPRVVVLLAGTNNISMWETPKQIAKSIAKIVSEIRQRSPDTKILIQGIFPFGRLVNRQRNNVKRINELLAHLDDKKYVFFLDFGNKFLNKDGTISQEVMPDFLHLGRQGYLIGAAAIKPTVHNLLNYTNEVA